MRTGGLWRMRSGSSGADVGKLDLFSGDTHKTASAVTIYGGNNHDGEQVGASNGFLEIFGGGYPNTTFFSRLFNYAGKIRIIETESVRREFRKMLELFLALDKSTGANQHDSDKD